MHHFLKRIRLALWILTPLIGVALTACAQANTPAPTSAPTTTPPALPTQTRVPPTPTVTSAPLITVTLSSIQMIDLTTGWAEGYVGAEKLTHILRTTDGGATWRDVSPILQSDYYGQTIFFLDTQNAWTFVFDTGELLRTQDGGQTWTSLGRMGAYTLWFNDSQHGWKMEAQAWGLSYVQFDISSFSTTQDGGQTWEEKNLPPDYGPAFLAFPNPQMAWAIRAGFAKVIEGFPNLGVPFFLETTTDGGQTWQSRKIPIPPGAKAVDGSDGSSYLDAGNCGFDSPIYSSTKIWKMALVCEKLGWVYTTINQGKTWIISPVPVGQVTHIRFINPTLGWLLGGDQPDPQWAADHPNQNPYHLSQSQLYQTTDGGQTWTLLQRTGWTDAQLDFVDAQTGWAVAEACTDADCNQFPYAKMLAKTTDSGHTWQTLQPQIAP